MDALSRPFLFLKERTTTELSKCECDFLWPQASTLVPHGGQDTGGSTGAWAHTLAPLVVSCVWLWANYLTTGRAAFFILIYGLQQMHILQTLLELRCFSFKPTVTL